MITFIIKQTQEPTVAMLTIENLNRELSKIEGASIIVEDSWAKGLAQVKTPLVCLVEDDCILSANYIASNYGLMIKHVNKGGKGGGYNKLAMITSCLGIRQFDNRIYGYKLKQFESTSLTINGKTISTSSWRVAPYRKKLEAALYPVQIGFVPGAIIRMRSISKDLYSLPWETDNLVELSAAVSLHLWGTGRRILLNPNTTYVSTENYLEDEAGQFNAEVPPGASTIFQREMI